MSVFDTIRSRISLPDYLGGILELKKAGGEYKTCCPFHDDDTPSFTVYEESGVWRWYCHGACKTGGDIIDFHGKKYNLTVVQSVKALAERYGINISEWSDNKPAAMSSNMARNTINDYFKSCLQSNADARKYLAERGITEEIIARWGLGYSDGRAYEYARDVLRKDDGTPNVQLITEIGIAKIFDNAIGNAIGAGKVTFPVKKQGAIGFWHLRSASKDKSREYQIVKEARAEGFLFFNQDDLSEQEFWLVEGPYDAIAIKEKTTLPVVACLGTPNDAQMDYLKSLKIIDEHYPELCKGKTIHLCLDRDSGEAGQNAAVKFVAEMSEYHTVVVHTLPVGVDVDDYLNGGGNIDEIEGKKHSNDSHKVIEAENKYWKRDKEGQKPISNFCLRRRFCFTDDDHNKTYRVHILKGNETSQLVEWNSSDFSNITSFREWLGFKGDYYFDGNQDDLTNMLKYIFDTECPQEIQLKDNYGHCIPGIWLFENGLVHNGIVTHADSDGVMKLPESGQYVKSKLAGSGEMPALIPTEWYTPKDIIQNYIRFYPHRREWVWKALGFATAMYYHNQIRRTYREFPVMACFGPSRRGKTAFAASVASLLGAGTVSNPSAKSTERGMERLISLLNSLPVVVNEYASTDLGDLVRDIYDRNSNLRALKTTDNRVHRSGINSTLITTSESVPSEASVQNRMILMDFDEFKKPADRDTQIAHAQWMTQGMQNGKNIGWLVALSAAKGEETIIDDIEYSRIQFIEQVGSTADPRTIYNYSVVFGSFRNACRVLGIPKILEDIGEAPIDPSRIYSTVIESSQSIEDLNADCSPAKIFVTILERLFIEGKANSFCRKRTIGGQDTLSINMRHAFAAVKETDNRGSKLLEKWTERDIYNTFREKLHVESSWMKEPEGKGSCRCIDLPLAELSAKWEVTFKEMSV